jgi:peptidoglycan/xylan/chitin deacetylase (PgdA/CDA1 family)
MALPFDDGLQSLLELLEEPGARATFFVAGEQVERARGEIPSGLCP